MCELHPKVSTNRELMASCAHVLDPSSVLHTAYTVVLLANPYLNNYKDC